MTDTMTSNLTTRFGEQLTGDLSGTAPDDWARIAARASCRHFKPEKIDDDVLDLLCALALCSPSKSDLQQRDIIIVDNPDLRQQLDEMMTGGPLAQEWISGAPHLLVFCGNNRRQRLLHRMRGHAFVNDHLDAFFNAGVDAGIALSAFVLAAEARGLGCCPISAIRNDAARVSDLLELPDHVFPVAGLAVGWPKFETGRISPRLPLAATVHRNTYKETGIEAQIDAYDARRNEHRPYASQRSVETFGRVETYGWSEDKARQYAGPEREGFGAFVRAKGFKLT